MSTFCWYFSPVCIIFVPSEVKLHSLEIMLALFTRLHYLCIFN